MAFLQRVSFHCSERKNRVCTSNPILTPQCAGVLQNLVQMVWRFNASKWGGKGKYYTTYHHAGTLIISLISIFPPCFPLEAESCPFKFACNRHSQTDDTLVSHEQICHVFLLYTEPPRDEKSLTLIYFNFILNKLGVTNNACGEHFSRPHSEVCEFTQSCLLSQSRIHYDNAAHFTWGFVIAELSIWLSLQRKNRLRLMGFMTLPRRAHQICSSMLPGSNQFQMQPFLPSLVQKIEMSPDQKFLLLRAKQKFQEDSAILRLERNEILQELRVVSPHLEPELGSRHISLIFFLMITWTRDPREVWQNLASFPHQHSFEMSFSKSVQEQVWNTSGPRKVFFCRMMSKTRTHLLHFLVLFMMQPTLKYDWVRTSKLRVCVWDILPLLLWRWVLISMLHNFLIFSL